VTNLRSPATRGAGQPWRLRLFLLASAILALAWDAAVLVRRARQGPWRVEVAGESMAPALLPGDWLLVDPTTARWPRRGTLVVVREPQSDLVVVKRVAGRPGDRVASDGAPPALLGASEAWLASDAPRAAIDSRRYGPVDAERLLGRVVWRYGPRGRFGRPATYPRAASSAPLASAIPAAPQSAANDARPSSLVSQRDGKATSRFRPSSA
jgi:signal peptidase I